VAEVSLPKSRPKNAAAIVKRDLKESKLKVPEISEETKKHRDQMALLEMRAELDPYLVDNPLARLGFDVLQRGVDADGVSEGKIYSYITDGDDSPIFSLAGYMGPSDRLDPKDNTGDFPFQLEKSPSFKRALESQGITSLLPPSEGSTVFFQQGRSDKFLDEGIYSEPKQGLSTLMHELAHLGFRSLEKDYPEISLSGRREEQAMDFMEQRSADKGLPVLAAQKNNFTPRTESIVSDMDRYARESLDNRGVPPIAKRIEPGIMESILGMFK